MFLQKKWPLRNWPLVGEVSDLLVYVSQHQHLPLDSRMDLYDGMK